MIHATRTLGFSALLAWSACAIAGGPASQELAQQLESDERERIYHELDEYSTKAYPGWAQLEERRQRMRGVGLANLDVNGVITREEAEQRMPGLARRFDEIDTDADGSIDRAELIAASERLRLQKVQHAKKEEARKAVPQPPAKKIPKRRSKSAPQPDVEATGA